MNLKRSRKVSLDGKVPEVNLKGLRALSGENEKGGKAVAKHKKRDCALQKKKKLEEKTIEVLKMLKGSEALYR